MLMYPQVLSVDDIDTKLPRIARAERRLGELSTAELAKQIGLTQPALSEVELGHNWKLGATIKRWQRLLNAFGLELHVEVRRKG